MTHLRSGGFAGFARKLGSSEETKAAPRIGIWTAESPASWTLLGAIQVRAIQSAGGVDGPCEEVDRTGCLGPTNASRMPPVLPLSSQPSPPIRQDDPPYEHAESTTPACGQRGNTHQPRVDSDTMSEGEVHGGQRCSRSTQRSHEQETRRTTAATAKNRRAKWAVTDLRDCLCRVGGLGTLTSQLDGIESR